MQNPLVTPILIVALSTAFLAVVVFALYLVKSGSITPIIAGAIVVTDALFKGMIITAYLRQKR